jgi:predicted nucleic-acid-binding Zn-ribbon protein
MWICQCGEQIEDRFPYCWKCGGKASTQKPISIECPHCKTHLEYFGKKQLYEGGHTAAEWGGFFVNRMNFDLYVCLRCGHIEFFVQGVGEELRTKNVMQDNSSKDEKSPAQ